MTCLLVYLVLLLAALNWGSRRQQMVATLPLLALDCLGSVLIRERFGTTLSAKAWDARTHTRWGWTHHFIDGLFGTDHCWVQWEREKHYGSVWTSWAAKWRGEVFKIPQPTPEA